MSLASTPRNSGKSNAVRALQFLVPAALGGSFKEASSFNRELDFFNALDERRIQVALPISEVKATELFQSKGVDKESGQRLLGAYADACAHTRPHLVLELTPDSDSFQIPNAFLDAVIESDSIGQGVIKRLSTTLAGTSGGDRYHEIGQVTKQVRGALHRAPDVTLVPPRRFIQASAESDLNSGTGFVERLRALQSPTAGQREERELYRRLNEGVSQLLNLENAQLTVPVDQDSVDILC